MKSTKSVVLVTALITVIITSACTCLLSDLRRSCDWLWMMSNVKAPGRMALQEIMADVDKGHYAIAKLKLQAMTSQWDDFEADDKFAGKGLGYIMVTFGQIEQNADKAATSAPAISIKAGTTAPMR